MSEQTRQQAGGGSPLPRPQDAPSGTRAEAGLRSACRLKPVWRAALLISAAAVSLYPVLATLPEETQEAFTSFEL
jgi:hypothetical protein